MHATAVAPSKIPVATKEFRTIARERAAAASAVRKMARCQSL